MQKEVERTGLLLKVNGQTLVDARWITAKQSTIYAIRQWI
jgi:hypothetical protein